MASGRKRDLTRREPNGRAQRPKREKLGDVRFVYVMQEAGGDAVKIGVSSNVARRVGEIEREAGRQMMIIWHIGVPFSQGLQLEQATHRRLKLTACHTRGEWYIIAPETAVDAIKAALSDTGIKPLKQMVETDREADRIANFRHPPSARTLSMASSLKLIGEF